MLFIYAFGIQLFHSTNKKPSHPTSPFLYSNRGVKREVNSWIRGNNSHVGLQIIDVF